LLIFILSSIKMASLRTTTRRLNSLSHSLRTLSKPALSTFRPLTQSIFSIQSLSNQSTIQSVRSYSSTPILSAGGSSGAQNADGTLEFNLADIGEGIAECEVLRWFISEGQTIKQFDKVCEVQSDKANVEITSRYDGTVTRLHYKVGELAKVGKPLIQIRPTGASAPKASTPAPSNSAPSPASTPSSTPSASTSTSSSQAPSTGKFLTSPATRRIAREESVDLSLVNATGPNGRILKEDVINYLKNKSNNASSAPSTSTCPVSAAKTSPSDQVVPIT
jgi:2-oxoisovalerate dehydrogenase E2 component (dihydrolipoyl transacylase)